MWIKLATMILIFPFFNNNNPTILPVILPVYSKQHHLYACKHIKLHTLGASLHSAPSLFLCVSVCRHAEISESLHPVGVSLQRSDHGDEERLLQQSDHGADHGLEACQRAKVVGRVAVGRRWVVTGRNTKMSLD